MNKQNKIKEENGDKIPIEREKNTDGNEQAQQKDAKINDAEINSALEKLSEIERQNAELRDTLLRKAAEFENYKRRNENDQLNIIKYAAESFIRNILPIYDDLERSLSHIDEATNFDSTKKGLLLVYEKFGKILDNQGVTKIDAKGKPFDVHYHEALMQQPAAGVPPHTVLEVLETGYMYKDRVIRHAKVIVSQEMDHSQDRNGNSENNSNNSTEQE